MDPRKIDDYYTYDSKKTDEKKSDDISKKSAQERIDDTTTKKGLIPVPFHIGLKLLCTVIFFFGGGITGAICISTLKAKGLLIPVLFFGFPITFIIIISLIF